MFDQRWILATGSTSGIGKSITEHLIKEGARLILVGRNTDKLLKQKKQFSGNVEIIEHDLENTQGIREKIISFSKENGRIYGFCHAAGIVETKPLAATAPSTIERIIAVNVVSGLEIARAITHRQVADKQCSLVWIGSVYSQLGAPGEAAYAASKGALIPSVRSIALELAPRKIRANIVSAGFVKTPMTDSLPEKQRERIINMHPLGPGSPEDISKAVLFLLAPENTWITGANLLVDGGYSAQ